MKNFQKGFAWLPVLLGLVVIIGISGGAYFYTHKQSQPTPIDISLTPAASGTPATTGNPSQVAKKSLLTFSFPQTGTNIYAAGGARISWTLTDASLPHIFPNKDSYIYLQLISADGTVVGVVGPAPSPHISDTSATWDIPGELNQKFFTLVSGAQYKIRATLSYEPHSISCKAGGGNDCDPVYSAADQALRDAARQYESESGWFTFDTNTYTGSGVPDMSKYTDNDFGFSFVYPSTWNVTEIKKAANLEDCTAIKAISAYWPKSSEGGIYIEEYNCPNKSITLRGVNGTNPVGVDLKYFFDTTTHAWMVTYLSDPPNGSPRRTEPVDVSNNTMGGLHILPGVERFGAESVVPLSATHFLSISTSDPTGYYSEDLLTKTLIATDPSVATPASQADQITVINAEKQGYEEARVQEGQ